MDLTTLYSNLKPFEPYFKLLSSFYYNEEGYPRIVDYVESQMTPEDHKIFKENITSLHKKFLELERLNMEILRLQNENMKLLTKTY